MSIKQPSDPLVIWRFSDSKPGHDSQSQGLVDALQRQTECCHYDINCSDSAYSFGQALIKKYSPGKKLPSPHLLIGAGHATHLPMLCARRARGGKIIVLMKPSLPLRLFDYCIIPEHDEIKARDNVILSQGSLNRIRASDKLNKHKGLILIGGESRHFHWHQRKLEQQLQVILESTDKQWTISDSRRTPEQTRQSLRSIDPGKGSYVAHETCERGWLQQQLTEAASIWVSRDSISMIYEALSAGGAVGLLDLEPKHESRVLRSTQNLIDKKLLTPFAHWKHGTELPVDGNVLQEAERCASSLLSQLDIAGRERWG